MNHLSKEEQALLSLGIRLSPVELMAFEAQLANNQSDVRLRVALAAHYSYRDDSPDHLAKYLSHMGWLIANLPTCGLLSDGLIYLKLTKATQSRVEFGRLWTSHLSQGTQSAGLLRNAAEFFTHFDLETAERLLLLAKNLEPANGIWDALLSNLPYRRANTRHSMSGENLRVRISKWRSRMEEALRQGDTESADAALHCQRHLEQELACLLKVPNKTVSTSQTVSASLDALGQQLHSQSISATKPAFGCADITPT
jgi:hypothetical protein